MSRKRYKYGQRHTIMSLRYELAFMANQKWKSNICKLGKVGRIPIQQLTRSRNKKQKETQIRIEKDGFKPGSRLE